MRPAHGQARKQRYNLTADPALVEKVRKRNGNLSSIFEAAMKDYLKAQELEEWKKANRESFDSFNRMIADRGLLSDEFGLL